VLDGDLARLEDFVKPGFGFSAVSPDRHCGSHRVNSMNYKHAEVAERAEKGKPEGAGDDTGTIKRRRMRKRETTQPAHSMAFRDFRVFRVFAFQNCLNSTNRVTWRGGMR
jgi:hypothetical protein